MAEAKSRYFGNAQSWLEDEPIVTPAPAVLREREEFKRKVNEAAESVGYVAPSEIEKKVSAPQPVVTRSAKQHKATIAKPVRNPELKSKGRPKGDRTVQMSVRIKQTHDDLIKAIAGDDFTVASIVEAAMVAFAKTLCDEKKYKRMPLDAETLKIAKRLF